MTEIYKPKLSQSQYPILDTRPQNLVVCFLSFARVRSGLNYWQAMEVEALENIENLWESMQGGPSDDEDENIPVKDLTSIELCSHSPSI